MEEDDDLDLEGAWADLRPAPLPTPPQAEGIEQTICLVKATPLSEAALADAFASVEAKDHKVVEAWVSTDFFTILQQGDLLTLTQKNGWRILGARLVVKAALQPHVVWLYHRPNRGSFG